MDTQGNMNPMIVTVTIQNMTLAVTILLSPCSVAAPAPGLQVEVGPSMEGVSPLVDERLVSVLETLELAFGLPKRGDMMMTVATIGSVAHIGEPAHLVLGAMLGLQQ